MSVTRAYKTELKVNNKQATLLRQHAGCARFAYNWGLVRRTEAYKNEGLSLNAISLHRELNILKKTDFPWMYVSSKCAPQESLRDLDKAFNNFFDSIKGKRKGKPVGYPQYKKKGKSENKFRLTGSIYVEEGRIKLPRIGWLQLKEKDYMPVCKPKSVTVKEKAGRWFVSITVEEEKNPVLNKDGEVTGIDLGSKTLATCSNGITYNNVKALRRNLKKLKRLSRQHSRKQKGSKNREKLRKKIARLHYKIACIRLDSIHKVTTQIAKTKPSVVAVEDLNVLGMLKNYKLAMTIADAGFGMLLEILKYKAEWNGFELFKIDRWFPSTKQCNKCKHVKSEMKLSERAYHCEECGFICDRDLNAAYNVRDFYIENNTVSMTGIKACGEESSGTRVKSSTKLSSVKQEADSGQKLCA